MDQMDEPVAGSVMDTELYFDSLNSVWEAVVASAQKVNRQQIKKLTDSMNGRLVTVIEKKDTGTIHKILEHDSNAFIISETSLCNVSAPVLSMKLHSEKRKLFVGYPEQMSVLDLQRCQDYNTSCEDCVLARDPYCAWTENGCTSQIKGGIQNIATGEPHICFNNSASKRLEQDIPSSFPTYPIVRTVPKGYPFYLSCPISSHHATYSWEHRGESKPCQRTQADCLYLIPAVSAHDYGTYNCVSKESNYKKMVKVYQLHGPSEPQSSNRAFKLTALKEWMLTVFTALLISTQ